MEGRKSIPGLRRVDFVAKRGSSIGLYRVFIPVSIYISVQSTFIKVVLGVSVWSSYLRGGVCFVLGAGPFSKPTWSPNLSEFKRRFDSEMTRGRGSATSYSSSWREQDLPYCYCFFSPARARLAKESLHDLSSLAESNRQSWILS